MGKKKDRRKSKGKSRSHDKVRERDRSKAVPPVDEMAWSPMPEGPPRGPHSAAGRPGPHDVASPPSPQAVEATELAARLASLGPLLQRQLAWADQTGGLTRSRLSALTRLVLGGPRTLGELATAEQVRPPTMTRLVRAMEADGLVGRERHPDDGRSVVIRATTRGERSLDEARSQQLAPLAAAISELGDGERRQLEEAADLLGRLLRDTTREPAGSAG